jgi:hypothetical protein
MLAKVDPTCKIMNSLGNYFTKHVCSPCLPQLRKIMDSFAKLDSRGEKQL